MTDNEVTSTETKSLLINDKTEDDNEDGMISSDNEIFKEKCIKDKLPVEEEKEDGALSSDGELSSDEDRHEELDYGDDTIEVINKEKHVKSDEEDGELSSSPDEGELTEDECSEDGEIRDDDNTHGIKSAYSLLPNSSQQEYSNLGSAHKSNGLCRFFMRGNCTWGNQCRYLHPISKNATAEVAIAPIADIKEEGRGESSWERGIRQAKEAKQTASKRKNEDIDFEEKKLHQQLPEGSPNKKDSDSDSSDSVDDKNKSPKRSRRSIPNENNYRHPPPFFNDQMRPMRPFYPGSQWNNANFAPPFIPHGGMGPGPMMMGPGPDGFGPPPFPGPFMGPRHPFPQDARMLIEEKRRQQMLFDQHPHSRFNTPDGPRNERYGQSVDQYPNKSNRDSREDRRNRNDRKPNQRADSWKDPWQRSQRSPKNRNHMDSRSRSRGRSSARGSRRSSYSSSYTSSSYSSRSSSYSSYSSRSSFDSRSRSSSRSRSRSSNESRSRSVRDKRTVTTGRDNKNPTKNKNNDKNKSNTRSPYNSNRQSYNKENHQLPGNSQGPIPDAYNRSRNNNNRGRSHNGRVDNRGRDRRYGGHRNAHNNDRRSNVASSPPNNKEKSPLRKVEVKSSNSKAGSDTSRRQTSDTADKRKSSESHGQEPSDDRRRHSSKSKNTSDNADRSDSKSERVNINRSMAFSESVTSREITDKKQNNSRKRKKKKVPTATLR